MNADLEDCFADDPAGVAATITAAAEAGTAGASVEDWSRTAIHPIGLATERVAAAVEAARPHGVVITARAENLIRGVRDLADTIARLQAYQEAGADVLYAPGLFSIDDVRVGRVVGRPARQRDPARRRASVSELAAAGVARISVGGALAWVSWGAVAAAARELLSSGRTQGYADLAKAGGEAARAALALRSASRRRSAGGAVAVGPAGLADRRVQHREQHDADGQHPERQVRRVLARQHRIEHERR